MEFPIGQRVVCIDTTPRTSSGAPILLAHLRIGTAYTVRSFGAFPGNEEHPTLRLEEITCPTIDTVHGPWEMGFAPDRFLPVKPTNIDVFQEILVRASDPVGKESDAQTKGTWAKPEEQFKEFLKTARELGADEEGHALSLLRKKRAQNANAT